MAGQINRVDFSDTVTTSGNSGVLDTSGMGQISFTASLSSVTGTLPTFQIELEASDDASNWNIVHDTRQFTTADVQRISGVRISSKYYRFSWIVGGSSPSGSLTITTTIKDYSPQRTGSLFRYNDLDLKTSSTSTAFSSFSNSNVGCMIVRGADTSTASSILIQTSNDNLNWHDHTGNMSISPSQTLNYGFSGNSHRFLRVKVVSVATGGGSSAPVHILWNSTGGS